jgi:hypothetical protein
MTILQKPRFELTKYHVDAVRLRLKASDGSEFIMEASLDGLTFFGDESSGGRSHEKPVRKSVDDIWDWIGKTGDRVALTDRAAVKRSRIRPKRSS